MKNVYVYVADSIVWGRKTIGAAVKGQDNFSIEWDDKHNPLLRFGENEERHEVIFTGDFPNNYDIDKIMDVVRAAFKRGIQQGIKLEEEQDPSYVECKKNLKYWEDKK